MLSCCQMQTSENIFLPYLSSKWGGGIFPLFFFCIEFAFSVAGIHSWSPNILTWTKLCILFLVKKPKNLGARPRFSYFLVLSVQPYNNPHLKCHLIFLYDYITERERRYSNRTTSPPCRSSRISWQKKPPGRKSLWKFPVVRDLCIFWRHFGVNVSFLFHLLFSM